jgi:hypothetical protein
MADDRPITASQKLDRLLEVGYHTQKELERFNRMFDDEVFPRLKANEIEIVTIKTKTGFISAGVSVVFAAATSAIIGVIVWALGGKT